MQQLWERSALVGGFACLIAAFVWLGCAAPTYEPARILPPPVTRSPLIKNPRFKDNIRFLTETNVTVTEVTASLGTPDWESTSLRLMAFQARNGQVLFVTYGTNNLIQGHEVGKLKAGVSLSQAASSWFMSRQGAGQK